LYRQPLHGARPVRISGASYVDYPLLSPNGSLLAGATKDYECVVIDLKTGSRRAILPGAVAVPAAWTADSRQVYTFNLGTPAGNIVVTDLETGHTHFWKAIGPRNLAGFIGMGSVVVAPDVNAYVYSARWDLSRLYLVDGWS
jgi:hypothetical protein